VKAKFSTLTAVIFLAVVCAQAQTPQKSFDALKSLAGDWVGKDPSGNPMQVSYRVTSGGSAMMGELRKSIDGESEDMISMIHMDGGRLLLTHYCQTGNQPRMSAATSPDGKTITFTMFDATGLPDPNALHMNRVVFTLIDATHHFEDWRMSDPGKEMIGHLAFEKK